MMSKMLPMVDFVVGVNLTRSNSGVGRATKKVQMRSDIPPEMDDSTVDENGQKVQTKGTTKASYKSTLMGSSSAPTQLDKIEDIFELHNENVITEVVDGIPSITFSK
ncbi:hypothetical protein Gogos_012756 [Gossypium gossypioides]|uniref:Uncharacterized protein n=1 Tax=Gossypium gossypioides TaxID=34282 RepID=A0A7J9BTG6_GOSGO|nr:hypothetical protein [Gossypium gossypioides]